MPLPPPGTGFLSFNSMPPRLHITADTDDFDEVTIQHWKDEGNSSVNGLVLYIDSCLDSHVRLCTSGWEADGAGLQASMLHTSP